MQFDVTDIITAFIALAGTIGAVWLPLRWGKKTSDAARKPDPLPPELSYPVEFREHERTRDLIRDQSSEMRNLFGQLQYALFGRPPADIAERVRQLDETPGDDTDA